MADTVWPLTGVKDNVQHLRKIHFSLLVACFALLSLTLLREPNEFEKSLEELEGIRGALGAWESDWVESAADALVNEQDGTLGAGLIVGADCLGECNESTLVIRSLRSPITRPAYEREFEEKGLRLRVMRRWSILPLPGDLLQVAGAGSRAGPQDPRGPLWTTMATLERLDPQFINPVPTEYKAVYQALDLARPESVGDFQRVWAALDTLDVEFATSHSSIWVAMANLGDDAVLSFSPLGLSDVAEDASPLVDLWLEPMPDVLQGRWRDATEHQIRPEFHLIGHTPWGDVSLLVETDHTQLSLRRAFIEKQALSWTPGSFASNFPSLSATIGEQGELPFDDIRAVLETESGRQAENITLFGLTLSADVVSKWGGAIIRIAQFYFWLHLRGLVRGLRNFSDATLPPWIGIYDDPLARATTALSAFLLPAVVVGVLAYGELVATPTLVVVAVLSLTLGLVSFRALKTSWGLLDNR